MWAAGNLSETVKAHLGCLIKGKVTENREIIAWYNINTHPYIVLTKTFLNQSQQYNIYETNMVCCTTYCMYIILHLNLVWAQNCMH